MTQVGRYGRPRSPCPLLRWKRGVLQELQRFITLSIISFLKNRELTKRFIQCTNGTCADTVINVVVQKTYMYVRWIPPSLQ